ncbi:MAG: TIGR03936 family radical SAM-associated protein, partial [Phycisphaerae bacterium]
GALRYICHAEMLKVFQRACARAGIKIQHSQGFNPRPRLSLPLPRPVGIESDDDLLCLRVERDLSEPQAVEYESLIKDKLSAQLPDGCELLSVEVPEAKSAPQPRCITYILSLRPEYADDRLKATIKHLSERKHIIVERKIDAEKLKIENRKLKIKEVNVRPFLKSIELDDRGVIVECKFTSAGSIRVDEILKLLELGVEELAAPVRRTNVQWQSN